jgi:ribosomal protein L40E
MAYSMRKKRLIALGICVKCGLRSAGRYLHCLRCRRIRAKLAPKVKVKRKPGPKPMPIPQGTPKTKAEYERVRRARNAAERAAGRGYWPDIHGEV